VGLAGWSPRELEDLVVPCADCGEYSTGVALGARDWMESPDSVTAEELDARIRKARGQGRAATEGGSDGLDGDTASAEPPWSVDATRVRLGSDPIACGTCGAGLPILRRDLASAHNRLTPKDIRWLHGYVAMKETVLCGLRHEGIGLRGDLGTFVTLAAKPAFIPSQKLLDLVDKKLLSRKSLLAKLEGSTRSRLDRGILPLPRGYTPPSIMLDVELGIGLAEIAKSLREHGKTPLRGLGTLRTATYRWDEDHGRLLYMEFDVRVRDDIARQSAAGR
jgi:hypothetical protein